MEKCRHNINLMALIKILNSDKDIRNTYMGNSFSIVNNILKPIMYMNKLMNVIIVDELIKYALMIESLIAMLYLEHVDEDIKSKKNNWL